MAIYNTGTVRVQPGSSLVTGTGTAFTTNVSVGNLFMIVGDSAFYQVAAVTNATNLTLSGRYANTSYQTWRGAEHCATTTGGGTSYNGNVDYTPVIQNEFNMTASSTTFSDNGAGNLTSSPAGDSGTVDYDTGAWTLNFAATTPAGWDINASYYSGDARGGASYQIVTDYTPRYGLPEMGLNDVNFPHIYTKAVREIDNRLYQLSALGTIVATTGLNLSSTQSEHPQIVMTNLNDDDDGPTIKFIKDSSSPAVNDYLGAIEFSGRDSLNNLDVLAYMRSQVTNVTSGSETSAITFYTMKDGTMRNVLALQAGSEIVVNEGGQDIDLRVESSGYPNAFFVNGANGKIGIGTNNPDTWVHITNTSVNGPVVQIESVQDGTTGGALRLKLDSGTPADNDVLGRVEFYGDNVTGTPLNYGYIDALSRSIAGKGTGGESGEIRFNIIRNGSMKEILTLDCHTDEVVVNEGGVDIDFRVESDTKAGALFVEGSSGNIGIGTQVPQKNLHMYSSSDQEPSILLESTYSAVDGPELIFYHNTPSPADNDRAGTIRFNSVDASLNETVYGQIRSVIRNADDLTEGGVLDISVAHNANLKSYLKIYGGYDVTGGEVVINEESEDVDFRWESNGNQYGLFCRGSDGAIGINESSPDELLHITSSSSFKPVIQLESTESGANSGRIRFTKNSSSPADGDDIGLLTFHGNNASIVDHQYGYIKFESNEVTTDQEAGMMSIYLSQDGILRNYLYMYGNIGADAGQIIFNDEGRDIDFRVESAVSAHSLFVEGTNGRVFISDDSNANMNLGLTINQGANDNEILALKSTDVDHGYTGVAETDTYANFQKRNAAYGGLFIRSLMEDAAESENFMVAAYGGTADTTKTTAGQGLTGFYVSEISNGNATDLTASGNAHAIRVRDGGAWRTVWIVDENGDYHYDGADGGAFDEYDDAQLVRTFNVVANPKDVVRSEFDKNLRYHEDDLIRLGILGDKIDNGGLINGAQLQRLLTGAAWQSRQIDNAIVQTLQDMLGTEFSVKLMDRLRKTGLPQIDFK